MTHQAAQMTSMTDVTAGAYADIPLFLFHLLEYMDVACIIGVAEINQSGTIWHRRTSGRN